MDSASRKGESHFLREVLLYRESYRRSQLQALAEERDQRHAQGEVYIAGCWVPEGEALKIVRELRRRDRIVFVEVILLLILFAYIAFVVWWIFAFLLLPDFGR